MHPSRAIHPPAMKATVILTAGWSEPLHVLRACADAPFAVGFLSDGSERGRWSYVLDAPVATFSLEADDPRDPFRLIAAALGPPTPGLPDGPPFQGGGSGADVLRARRASRADRPRQPSGMADPRLRPVRGPASLRPQGGPGVRRRPRRRRGRGRPPGPGPPWTCWPAPIRPRRAPGVLAEGFDPTPPDAGDIYERSVAAVVGAHRGRRDLPGQHLPRLDRPPGARGDAAGRGRAPRPQQPGPVLGLFPPARPGRGVQFPPNGSSRSAPTASFGSRPGRSRAPARAATPRPPTTPCAGS